MELLTIDEVAELFKVSRMTIHRWVKRGYIIPVRLGGRIRFVRKELEKSINESMAADATVK